MSILTAVPAIPTTHNGIALPPSQIAAAVNYLAAINGPTTFRVRWTTDKAAQTRAAHRGHRIVATSEAMVTVGTDYADLPQNTGREVGPLRGKNDEWLLFPWLIVAPTGIKARIYPIRETIRTTYTVDGTPVPAAEARAMLYSRKPSNDDVLTMDVFIDTLTVL